MTRRIELLLRRHRVHLVCGACIDPFDVVFQLFFLLPSIPFGGDGTRSSSGGPFVWLPVLK